MGLVLAAKREDGDVSHGAGNEEVVPCPNTGISSSVNGGIITYGMRQRH